MHLWNSSDLSVYCFYKPLRFLRERWSGEMFFMLSNDLCWVHDGAYMELASHFSLVNAINANPTWKPVWRIQLQLRGQDLPPQLLPLLSKLLPHDLAIVVIIGGMKSFYLNPHCPGNPVPVVGVDWSWIRSCKIVCVSHTYMTWMRKMEKETQQGETALLYPYLI